VLGYNMEHPDTVDELPLLTEEDVRELPKEPEEEIETEKIIVIEEIIEEGGETEEGEKEIKDPYPDEEHISIQFNQMRANERKKLRKLGDVSRQAMKGTTFEKQILSVVSKFIADRQIQNFDDETAKRATLSLLRLIYDKIDIGELMRSIVMCIDITPEGEMLFNVPEGYTVDAAEPQFRIVGPSRGSCLLI